MNAYRNAGIFMGRPSATVAKMPAITQLFHISGEETPARSRHTAPHILGLCGGDRWSNCRRGPSAARGVTIPTEHCVAHSEKNVRLPYGLSG